MKMKKFIALLTVAGMTATMAVGCGSSSNGTSDNAADTNTESSDSSLSGTITAAGSSALKPLADDAADSFLNDHPDVSITIDAGGSGEGLKQVSEGTVDIGNSDVAAEDKLDETAAKELVDHQVCVVTMAPIVNKDVAEAGVKSLTKEQLISIFIGKTTNWKDVGGPDEDIVLVTRPESSGTRATFKKTILGDAEEKKDFQTEESSGAVSSKVQSTPGAISYLALSYVGDGKDLNVLKINDVEANAENIANGSYPFWSYEYMITKGEPTGVTKAFIDYLMSGENKSVVEAEGYIPMSSLK